MHVYLLVTGKLRHHIEITHGTIEIVVEPALNPQLRPNTCLGMVQAWGGWRGQRGCGAISTLGNMKALSTPTGAAQIFPPSQQLPSQYSPLMETPVPSS